MKLQEKWVSGAEPRANRKGEITTSSPVPSPLSKWRSENPLAKAAKMAWILSRKHDEMFSFRLNNGFRLQKTNKAARRWKQPPKKSFHHVSKSHNGIQVSTWVSTRVSMFKICKP